MTPSNAKVEVWVLCRADGTPLPEDSDGDYLLVASSPNQFRRLVNGEHERKAVLVFE